MFSIEYSIKLAEKYFNDEKEHTMLIKSTRDVSRNTEVKKEWRDISKDDLWMERFYRISFLVAAILTAASFVVAIYFSVTSSCSCLCPRIGAGFAAVTSIICGIAALKLRLEGSRLKIKKGDEKDPILNALCVDNLTHAYGKLNRRSFTNLVHEGYLTQEQVKNIHEILDDSTTTLDELHGLEDRHYDGIHKNTDRYKEITGEKKTDAETGKTIPELKQRWRDLQAEIKKDLEVKLE